MKITDMIRRKTGSRSGRANVRRIFVVIQFAVCILFLAGTLTAIRQLRFVAHKDLGFARENLLLTPIGRMGGRAEAFRDELLSNPEIAGVSLSAVRPGEDFDWPQLVLPEGAAADQALKIPVFSADAQCFPTLGIPIIDGRNFLDSPGDRGRAAIINQTAARKFGWTSPVGKRLLFPGNRGEAIVVGVVKDFNLESLHKDIGPYVFTCATGNSWYALVRVNSARLSQTIQFIKSARRKIAPDDVLDVEFVDEKIAAAYREDERTQKILTFASALAVTIACLGLLGLAAFAAESRIKEIGIRKTLGASAPSVVALLGKEFALCVLAANLLAWPAAALLMKNWLRNFAFRVPLSWGTFVLSAASALLMAMLVVAYQAIKAALADPIDALRYE